MKKYAIIGFGGLGKTHFINLLDIEKKRGDISLCAICNEDLSSIKKNISLNIGTVSVEDIDFSKYNLYTDYREMIEKEDISFVFIALPTYLHAPVAIDCLKKGIDVYVEKPMALTKEQCKDMLDTATENGRRLMVGHCLRFTDEYMFLKECIENGTYGNVVKAEFSRKSPIPKWSFGNWLLDEGKSGGCIVDMHVHDVDVMMWLFGKPDEVVAYSSHSRADYESVYALYKYPHSMVSIIGDWGMPSSYKFNASYSVTFENAHVEFRDNVLTVYDDEGEKVISCSGKDPLYREADTFISACVDKDLKSRCISADSVYETMKLIFKEKKLSK